MLLLLQSVVYPVVVMWSEALFVLRDPFETNNVWPWSGS